MKHKIKGQPTARKLFPPEAVLFFVKTNSILE